MLELRQLLANSSEEDHTFFADLMCCSDSSPESLIAKFTSLAEIALGYRSGHLASYRRIVTDLALKLEVAVPRKASLQTLEFRIAKKVFKSTWAKMGAEQKADFTQKLREAARLQGVPIETVGTASIFRLLLWAKGSEFGVYMLASASLKIVTAALGITAPFVVYMGLSRVIAVFVGPIGWALTGIQALWSLHKAYERRKQKQLTELLAAVLFISTLRSRTEEGL